MIKSNTKPNVILVLTDDQGYGDLGCTGNPIIKTPALDKFCNESVRLTNFHTGPTCAPTRSGLMTGHYANSTGVWHTIGGRSLLRKDEWTIATALEEQGYQTAIFGKWHLGDEYPYRPMDRGFKQSIVHGGGGIGQTPDYWGNDYFDDTYYVNGKPKKFKGYCTDVFFSEALKFIEENKNNPFYCHISTNAPHSPFNVARRYSDIYADKMPEDRAGFYGMITNIDENFGVLRQKLRQWGIEDNTILVFMTDNGTSEGVTLDSKGFVTDGYNVGLRGQKNWEYDGGHRVPFFISWSGGKLDHGNDVNQLTAYVDFMPTILDLCGIPVKKEITFHGKSLAPLIKNHESIWEERVMVTDSQRNAYPSKWRKSAVMTNRWRLVNGKELYDMNNDREQRINIADNHPDVVNYLRDEYNKWWGMVTQKFDHQIPVVLGDTATDFTNHDMRNEECDVAWNQQTIREGKKVYGYWEIEIEKDGIYQIELRRWPNSENRPLSEGINGDDVEFSRKNILKKYWGYYSGGRALFIKNANISIQGRRDSKSIKPGDSAAIFILELQKGQTTLEAWFDDGRNVVTSVYYIHVEPVTT